MRKLLLSIVLVSVWGCSEQPVEDNHVIAVVNGYALRAVELNRYVDMMAKVQGLMNIQASGKGYQANREMLSLSFPDVYIANRLVEEYAKKENIVPSKALLKQFQTKAVRNLEPLRARNYQTLLKKLGKNAECFDKIVCHEALQEAVKVRLAELTPTNLTPADIKVAFERVKLFNEAAEATNKLVFARANKVWEQLKKGANFVEMAKKYSEIEAERDDNGEWGTLDLNQFTSDKGVYEWGNKLKVGEFSPPFEGDNGLMILRLDAIDNETKERTFSRIFFLLPMFSETPNEAEYRKEVQELHKENLLAAKFEELYKSAKIEYVDPKLKEAKQKEERSTGK